MKKVAYLMTMILALALVSTSCCKDDPVPDPNESIITLTELNGMWNFQKFEYDGITDITLTTMCEDIDNPMINPETAGMRWIKLSFNIDASGCDLIDDCDGSVLDNILTLDDTNNRISLDNGLVWEILSYDNVNEILVLKLIEDGGSDFVLNNATYTLMK